jgi:hypothetical protein
MNDATIADSVLAQYDTRQLHRRGCKVWTTPLVQFDDTRCTCGLTSALERIKRIDRAQGWIACLRAHGITLTFTNDRPDRQWGGCFLRDTSAGGSWSAASMELLDAIEEAARPALASIGLEV